MTKLWRARDLQVGWRLFSKIYIKKGINVSRTIVCCAGQGKSKSIESTLKECGVLREERKRERERCLEKSKNISIGEVCQKGTNPKVCVAKETVRSFFFLCQCVPPLFDVVLCFQVSFVCLSFFF